MQGSNIFSHPQKVEYSIELWNDAVQGKDLWGSCRVQRPHLPLPTQDNPACWEGTAHRTGHGALVHKSPPALSQQQFFNVTIRLLPPRLSVETEGRAFEGVENSAVDSDLRHLVQTNTK